jgi:WhiB family transcriptional regulator, redox-sensing transcriptional regulator
VTWRDDAACKGADTDLFHPPFQSGGKTAGAVAYAKSFCGRCTVRQDCLGFALRVDRDFGVMPGVWGGMTPGERARLAARRAS